MWSGLIAAIPFGWYLCDGTNDTPDLTDKFIVGAGLAYAPGNTNVFDVHQHDFTADGHSHSLPVGLGVGQPGIRSAGTLPISLTGTTDNTNAKPPWYAICYLMYKGY